MSSSRNVSATRRRAAAAIRRISSGCSSAQWTLFGEIARIAWREQQAVLHVVHELAHDAGVHREDGYLRGHGLRESESEPLEQAREQEEVRGREQAIDVVAWPEHPDVVAQPHLLDA